MNSSPWNDERVTAYVLGELPVEESRQLETEIETNVELAAAVTEARGITGMLKSMYAAESPQALDSSRRDAILESSPPLAAVGLVGAVTQASRMSWRPFALAASAILVASLGVALYRTKQPNIGLVVSASADKRVDSFSREFELASDLPALADEVEFERESIVKKRTSATEPQELAVEEKQAAQMPASKPEPLRRHMSIAPTGPAPAAPRFNLQLDADAAAELRSKDESRPLLSKSLDVSNGNAEYAVRGGIATKAEMGKDIDGDYGADSGTGKGYSRPVLKGEGIEIVPTIAGMAPGDQSTDGLGQVADTPFSTTFGESNGRVAVPFFRTESADDAEMWRDAVQLTPEGRGAGLGGDRFEPIIENDFKRVAENPLSTFSIDVDTASYSKLRQFVMQAGRVPPAGSVRIEELVNYFDYDYEPPAASSEHPFASRVEVAACPWNSAHRLARIAIKGKVIANESRPASNLVFLVDTSGSMEEPSKLPLVKQGLQKLVSRLGERDRVAIVVYAGSAGLVLDSTSASDQPTILRRINQMQSGGSTNGGQGIQLAYQVAREHFITNGVNRVILCSDGDFNVGLTSDDELVRMVERESKGGIDITVLGFGMGNHNDAMMEKISGRGNGNYAFIDTQSEANRVLAEQTSSTLVTIARDVKIQVEFNPAEVAAYRLIGYENRALAAEDFKDDTKDAGEIGAGHAVTAFYELIPAGQSTATVAPPIDDLRYQQTITPNDASRSGELMTVKLRYKKPNSDTSIPVSFPASDSQHGFAQASSDFRFAAAVAGFGMILRSSEHSGSWTMADISSTATASKGSDLHGLRGEFIEIARRVAELRGQEQ